MTTFCGVSWCSVSHVTGTVKEMVAALMVLTRAGVISRYWYTLPAGGATFVPGPGATVLVTIAPEIPVPVMVTCVTAELPPTFTLLVLDVPVATDELCATEEL